MVWMNKQLTFFDFFSGIGGFRIGLERAGFKCVGYCDNDEYVIEAVAKKLAEVINGTT